MNTKRTNLLAGSLLGAALLLGTAGLALAQDPTSTPTPPPAAATPGGMMNGQGMGAGQGMMNGQGMGAGQGMMNGQGMGAGQGMMNGQKPDMIAMHAAMSKDGTCDPALMPSMHDLDQPSR